MTEFTNRSYITHKSSGRVFRFRAIILLIGLILLVQQTPSRACCAYFSFWELKYTTFIENDDPSIAFTVFKYNSNESRFEAKGKDTICQSEMIADLQQSYDSSQAVLVAFISRAYKFVLAPDSNRECFYAESVTVKIERVIKGSLDKNERVFVSSLKDGSFKLVNNSITGNTDTIYSPITSLYDQGYKAIEGVRFLLFLNNKESSDSNLTIQKPHPCISTQLRYLVDNSNKVYFDGIEIDPITNKVKKVSLQKIDLDKVIQVFSNTENEKMNTNTSVKFQKRIVNQAISSKYQAYCDLMGKKVTENYSDRNSMALRRIISFECGYKKNAEMIIR